MEPLLRDAVAVLAHVLLRFDRAEEARALLAALIELDADPAWARQAHCLALLRAGRSEDAVAAAEGILTDWPSGPAAAPMLHVAAKAAWRLGQVEKARAYAETAQSAASIGLRPGTARRR
ncbi:hypothetical protein JMJ56_18545 [Belnapia sp. T18]|uniref:Tetratricopeptide repeat-containing protein n=1 Tax=Belnapia arida TaxID=2804533 RepID=A0ABS1U5S6_9PROT|nr:hypothetical protein [Belnapia arida]MBL6080024.1 hypothetical protein [Belnapia arida]